VTEPQNQNLKKGRLLLQGDREFMHALRFDSPFRSLSTVIAISL
jgi:hypothetical protein